MFSREEMGDHALKLDQADAAFKASTRASRAAASGATARQSKEKWTRSELVVLPHPAPVERAARR